MTLDQALRALGQAGHTVETIEPAKGKILVLVDGVIRSVESVIAGATVLLQDRFAGLNDPANIPLTKLDVPIEVYNWWANIGAENLDDVLLLVRDEDALSNIPSLIMVQTVRALYRIGVMDGEDTIGVLRSTALSLSAAELNLLESSSEADPVAAEPEPAGDLHATPGVGQVHGDAELAEHRYHLARTKAITQEQTEIAKRASTASSCDVSATFVAGGKRYRRTMKTGNTDEVSQLMADIQLAWPPHAHRRIFATVKIHRRF